RLPHLWHDNVRGHKSSKLIRGALPLGLPYTLSRSPLRRLAPFAWLARDARSRRGERIGGIYETGCSVMTSIVSRPEATMRRTRRRVIGLGLLLATAAVACSDSPTSPTS